jgi:SPP1 gp7 family putative phage head morphogenesis protein
MELSTKRSYKSTTYVDVKKANKSAVINNQRIVAKKNILKLKKVFMKFFAKAKAQIISKITKSDDPILDSIDWEGLVPDVSLILGAMATDGALQALSAVNSELSPTKGAASTWAENRAAEMIGKKIVNGELVDNPDAKWVISDTTREMIQSMIADATDQGVSTDELASILEDSFAFSSDRAEMIARTEIAMADSAGQMQGYVESGVVEGTEWTTAEDDAVDEECTMNADAGVIPLGELYPSGDEAPPAHPNCRCALVPALMKE